MFTVKDRIDEFIKYLGIAKYRFERNCGLNTGVLSNTGDTPSGVTLLKILNTYPDLSTDWLMRGEGDMLKSKSLENTQLANNSLDITVDEPVISLEDDGLTVGERLDLFIKYKGLGRYQFEMKCGLSQGYVNNIRNSPHPDKLKRIANVYPELNIEWLMIGKGEMLHPNNSGLYKMVEAHRKLIEMKLEIEKNKRNALEEKFQEITSLLRKLTKK